MGTVSNSLASTAAPVTSSGGSTSSSSSSTSPSTFTGSSAYSQDFQNVINRAVAIASLPINLLTAQQTTLNNQSAELTKLDTTFTALQTAVQGVQKAFSGSSFQSDISDPKSIGASLSDGATEGYYSINVDSIGAYASSLTGAGWDSTPKPPTTYKLLLGTTGYSFTPADNSAATVAATINSQFGSMVQATAVNVGSASAPSYRVSLQGTSLAPMALDIQTVQAASLQTQTAATSDGFATSQTAATWTATGNPASYNLQIGSSAYEFNAADDSAATVVNSINNNATLANLVTASLVDLGTGGSHDYRVALQNKAAGATTLDLQQVTSFQKPLTTGLPASYAVDGGSTVTSSSRSVTVSNGVALNLLAPTNGPVGVTVTRSTSALSTALSTFTDAYNAAVDEVESQRGQSGGALQGQSILSSLSRALSSISTFGAGGSIASLKSLGVELGADGHLTFTPLTLMGADLGNSPGVTSFFGNATSGGFLENATTALNNLLTTGTGLLKTGEADLTRQITNLGTQISDKQTQVDALQLQLQNQMAASDALISSMEQQSSYLSQMLAAQDTASRAYSA
jgi:flagellar hook-associated protein 2